MGVVVVVVVVEGLAVDIGGKRGVERIKRLPTAVGVCLLASKSSYPPGVGAHKLQTNR